MLYDVDHLCMSSAENSPLRIAAALRSLTPHAGSLQLLYPGAHGLAVATICGTIEMVICQSSHPQFIDVNRICKLYISIA